MPEGSDTVVFLILQWKLQIFDGNILICLGKLLDGVLYGGAECLIHSTQHTQDLCLGMLCMNIAKESLIYQTECFLALRIVFGIAGIIGAKIYGDQIRFKSGVIPFFPHRRWFVEELLAAAGIGVLIQHRYQPGVVSLIALSDICGNNALAVPGNDFEICIQSTGGFDGVGFGRIFYGSIMQ